MEYQNIAYSSTYAFDSRDFSGSPLIQIFFLRHFPGFLCNFSSLTDWLNVMGMKSTNCLCILFKILFLILFYVYQCFVCLQLFISTSSMPSTQKGQKKVSNPLKLDRKLLAVWILRTEPGSCSKTAKICFFFF